jgi:hypothetical protein
MASVTAAALNTAGDVERLLWGVQRGRDLTPTELERLVVSIGRQPELWRPFAYHDPQERFFTRLHLDRHVEIWLLCWTNGQKTDVHDHGASAGAFYVCEGRLLEDRFATHKRMGGGALLVSRGCRSYRAGQSTGFDAPYVHAVRHARAEAPASSVHAYSPPLERMGYYAPDAGQASSAAARKRSGRGRRT